MEALSPAATLTASAGARERLIVALDFPSSAAALELVDRLDGRVSWFKVGLELYLATGPSIVHTLRDRGFNVFVDLKLHDIPNTVAGAIRSLRAHGASLLTVHAGGGLPMLRAAVDAASDGPRVLAVTVLTSMDSEQLAVTGVNGPVGEQVLRLGHLAELAGVAGLVCSPLECLSLRAAIAPDRLLVVPGIRPAGFSPDDQSRIATPASALRDGASYLVVGRPVTKSSNPAEAVERILCEMNTELGLATAH